MSDEYKSKGNTAFQSKNFEEAITWFTKGIEVDSKNHVLYSNRSAAYGSLHKWNEAFQDALKCVEVAPTWAKGYSRLGSALHGLGRFDEAISAFDKGLGVDPNMDALKTGKAAAQHAKAVPTHPLAQVFTPQLLQMMVTSNDPKIKELRDDRDFMGLVTKMIQDPSIVGQHIQDPRVMTLLSLVVRSPDEKDNEPTPPPPPKKKEPEPVKELTEEEKAKLEIHKQAEELKTQGTAHYKKKEFEKAIEFYTKASEVEKSNIVYLNNIAAVHLEKGDYEACLKQCDEAIEKGRELNSDFKDIAKAITRKGTCYSKQGMWEEATKEFKTSLLEHRCADTLDKLNKCQEAAKKAKEEAYFSEELCEKARLEGNEFFKTQKFKDAIDCYSEAIKRNPKAHAVYSNRAAAYIKMGAYDDAERDCNKCLKLEPTFTKAVTRLATIYYFRKEYHKAMVEYKKGMDMDPENVECKQGFERTMAKIQETSGVGGENDEQRTQRAMADPEIRAIFNDTYMQQVLRELQENPRNLNHYLKSPDVMAKINKLIAAGIIKTA
eukprot:TRINITY_DN332_c1_g1_i2.p1 TRINITY_DN332_c1_g1~~TRINITY_DN332_c1_g1_i2.p1  ORF type:complete len:548 (+),score=160.11 TRINITY_DN332_c1_g1_i2:154-1797(+)